MVHDGHAPELHALDNTDPKVLITRRVVLCIVDPVMRQIKVDLARIVISSFREASI